MLALIMGLAMLACTPDQKMENPGEIPENPENPEIPETPENPDQPTEPEDQFLDCYVLVTAGKTDWSGDYLIAAEDRNGKEVVFAKWQKFGRPAAGVDLRNFKDAEGRIPASAVENCKTVISRNGEMYSVYVSNVGYLGVENRHNITYITEVPVAERFHWTLSYEPDYGVSICNFENDGQEILWNDAPDCLWFGTYPSAHDDIRPILLYERVQIGLHPANVEQSRN